MIITIGRLEAYLYNGTFNQIMEREDCVFCKIVSGKVPSARLYEDESVIAILDINPISD
ncbi:histidine triad family protein, partial [mine drainage metagenome]